MKKLSTIIGLMLYYASHAQPGDAQIKTDVGGNGAHVKSFKFTKNTGTRQWNSSVGNWEYVRGILVVRTSPDFPEYDLEVRGDAVYQDMGGGKYSYRRFRVLSNRYLGIPYPTIAEIETALSHDWKKFYRTMYQRIYKIHEPLRFTEEEYFFWYNPNSVEITLKNKVEFIASDIETKVADVVYKVRLYRKNPEAPWDNFVGGQEDSHEEYKEYSSQKIDYQKAERLRKQTLAYTMGELQAKQQLASSGTTSIPAMNSATEIASYLHKLLIQGNENELRGFLQQMMAPHHYVGDSKVQLNDRAKLLIDNVVDVALKGDGTYAQQYCPQPAIDARRSTDKHIYINGGRSGLVSQISCIQADMGYQDGKPMTGWRISDMQIRTLQDQDGLDYFASLSSPDKLCNSSSAVAGGTIQTGNTTQADQKQQNTPPKTAIKNKLKGLIKQ